MNETDRIEEEVIESLIEEIFGYVKNAKKLKVNKDNLSPIGYNLSLAKIKLDEAVKLMKKCYPELYK